MQRALVLTSAAAAVADRGLNYGSPEDNFARIARLWTAHLLNRDLIYPLVEISEGDVAIMMGLVKDARLANDMTHADSWVDKAGYAACGGEVTKAGANDNTQHDASYEELLKECTLSGTAAVQWLGGDIRGNRPISSYPTVAAPETKFGFTVGETVNAVTEQSGTVVGFFEDKVLVTWAEESEGWPWNPADLRHGP